MDLQVAAKGTKPGNKASMRTPNGKPARVPVGTLHLVDVDNQDINTAMYEAVCGETHLVAIDYEWDSKVQNERCPACEDVQWQASFAAEQDRLLK